VGRITALISERSFDLKGKTRRRRPRGDEFIVESIKCYGRQVKAHKKKNEGRGKVKGLAGACHLSAGQGLKLLFALGSVTCRIN